MHHKSKGLFAHSKRAACASLACFGLIQSHAASVLPENTHQQIVDNVTAPARNYWPGLQSSGAESLSLNIARSQDGGINISWPRSLPNIRLQRTTRISPQAPWLEVAKAAETDGVASKISLQCDESVSYFRLISADSQALASTMGQKLAAATTDQVRYDTVLEIMSAIRFGIYTASFEPISEGAERGIGDFYLYDYELGILSRSLGRGDRFQLEDLANYLPLVFDMKNPATAQDLLTILRENIQASRNAPGDVFSFAPLLIHQLGLSHSTPQDLLKGNLIPSDVKLDALQFWLLLADLAVPFIQQGGPVQIEAPNRITGRIGLSGLPEKCRQLQKLAAGAGPIAVGKWTIPFMQGGPAGPPGTRAPPNIGAVLRSVTVTIDALHAPLLAFCIKIEALTPYLTTHYGHSAPGKELRFQAVVQMLDELPEHLTSCGWILGVDFPAKGPISGLEVVWTTGGFTVPNLNELEKHGTANVGFPYNTTTDANGIAELVFQPKIENIPQIGPADAATDELRAVAMHMTKFKNVIGFGSQWYYPKQAILTWNIGFHMQPRFELEFNSEMVSHADSGMAFDISVSLLPPLWQLDRRIPLYMGTNGVYRGDGFYSYEAPAYSGSDCDFMEVTGKGTAPIEVIKLAVIQNGSQNFDAILRLGIPQQDPLDWIGHWRNDRGDCIIKKEFSRPTFSSFYNSSRFMKNQLDASGAFEDNWTYVGGGYGGKNLNQEFLKKEETRTEAGYTEKSVFKLWITGFDTPQ